MTATYQRWLIARGNVFMPSAASIVKLIEELRTGGFIVDPSAPAQLGALQFSGPEESLAKATGGYAVKTVENTFGNDDAAKMKASREPQPQSITAEWLDHPDREELRLVWPVRQPAGSAATDVALKYPLSLRPDDRADYALELHRALEYVYPISGAIGRLPTTCHCGEDLDFEWDEDEVVPAFRSANGIFAECDECSRTFDPSKGSAKIKNPFDGTVEKIPGGAAYRFALKVDCGEHFVASEKLAFSPDLTAIVEKTFGRQFYEVGATG